ncbi:MAG: class I SAM-dependent methyltransferase [Alphaproteobacteria bacterium]
MLAPDIVSLKEFYATELGESARIYISSGIHAFWPEAKDELILGIGYATPFLSDYLNNQMIVAACMPANQGAAYWPANRANLTFLSHESELPLRENTVNRVLLVHSVETSEQLSWMLREVWRVLTPGGRVLAVVPNRMGLWARSSRSPFGYGLPFSMAQLKGLLSTHDFTLTRSRSALFMPPLRSNILWRLAAKVEILFRNLCPFFGGVLLVEAEKQVYAAIKQPVAARKFKTVPAARPVMSKN